MILVFVWVKVSLPLTLKLTPLSQFLSFFNLLLSIFTYLPLCPSLYLSHNSFTFVPYLLPDFLFSFGPRCLTAAVSVTNCPFDSRTSHPPAAKFTIILVGRESFATLSSMKHII